MNSTSGIQSAGSLLVFGTFFLNGEEFALDMNDLQEVVEQPRSLHRMPLSPEYLLGLYNLRDFVLPVIDLHVLLRTGARREDVASSCRMAVLRRGRACLGVLFDSIGEIVRVRASELLDVDQENVPPGMTKMPVRALLLRDEGKRVLQVLDLSSILSIHNLPLIDAALRSTGPQSQISVRVRDLFRDRLIGFRIGDCRLAIEMKSVSAIILNQDTLPSPCRTFMCERVIQFQGHPLPVVQLRKLLRLETSAESLHIIVCRLGEELVALEVDQTVGIIPYAEDKILPIPVLDDFRADVFRGCFTDREGVDFIVLKEAALLSRDEVRALSVSHKRHAKGVAALTQQTTIVQRTSMLVFRLEKLYAIRLLDVVEIVKAPSGFTRAPNMPATILGVHNLRGNPIPVVEPRKLFGLSAASSPGGHLLIFLHQSRRIAMLVDAIEGIVPLSEGEEDTVPSILFGGELPPLGEAVQRCAQTVHEGRKSGMVVLNADQIVQRLADSMAA